MTKKSNEPVQEPIVDKLNDIPSAHENGGNNHEGEGPELSEEMLQAWANVKDIASPVTRTAERQAKLQKLRLPYPRQLEAMTAFESVRLLGTKTKGQPQIGLNLFEDTGCGKSTAAEQYRLLIERTSPPGTKPVLHVSLGTSGSAKQLYTSIMAALGDGFATAGYESTLRVRAMKMMQSRGTQLLILDEAHHAGRSGFRGDITAEVKLMLDMGVVPIVLLGTEEAVPILASAKELSGRLMSPCRLGALDWSDEDDRELWIGLIKSLDARMVKEGIVARLTGLDDPVLAESMNEVSNGVIGQLMRIMLEAIRISTFAGREHILVEDLAEAVDNWSIEHGFSETNPLWDLCDLSHDDDDVPFPNAAED
jgi:hypothetical protein